MSDLQTWLDDFLAVHPHMPGVLMRVEAPSHGVHWSGAAGVAERDGAALDPGQCFRTASITKTFVAAAILRLWERGELEPASLAVDHLPTDARARLVASVPDAGSVTIEHLLRHTAGIRDFGQAPEFHAAVGAEPSRVWTALDQLDLAFAVGPPYGPPGEAFHYSDTGYVLLGLVLEHRTGAPLAAALRALVGFAELGLTATWLEGKEPPPEHAPARAHQYMGKVDTFAFDPSFDGNGGGGLVSTTHDLVAFLRALVGGRVLGPAATAAMLRTTTPTDLGNLGQTMGLGIFESTVDGIRRIGHEGYWGVWVYHFPDHDITVAGVHTDLQYDGAAKQALLNAPVRLLAGDAR